MEQILRHTKNETKRLNQISIVFVLRTTQRVVLHCRDEKDISSVHQFWQFSAVAAFS